MSDSEFGAVEFALGSIIGNRTWQVTVEGRLRPIVTSSSEWTPGENIAECHGHPSKEAVPQIEGEDWKDRREKVEAWRANHAMEDCTHGFYAYFGGQRDQYSQTLGLSGVIEGYGEVLVGSKGFRATKAKILALSTEGHEGMWVLEPHIIQRLRANYPKVAFFESTFAMYAEFPADHASKFEAVPA